MFRTVPNIAVCPMALVSIDMLSCGFIGKSPSSFQKALLMVIIEMIRC
jgi:hypothetical protein